MNDDINDNNQEEAPSGALPQYPTPDAQEDTRPPFNQVIDRLPKDKAAEFLKLLNKFGVDHEDPLVTHINILLDTKEAGDNALSAASRIEAATSGVGDAIYTQTARAGGDLKDLVAHGIRETTLEIGKKIGAAIQVVVTKGAEQIKLAAGEVDQTARDQLNVTIQEYKGNLARAAMEEAKKRSAFVGAVRWGVVAMVIFGSILFGGFIIYAGLDMTSHILPWTDHLINIKGRADCGFIQSLNGRVCGVN
ncbi:hypothetical protein [Acidiferrobacter sp.]